MTQQQEPVVPVAVLLDRAAVQRSSPLANNASRYAAQVLEGIAHDSVCGCEDSTVQHLADWVADQAAGSSAGSGEQPDDEDEDGEKR